jgi:two-component system KDP operon response regulator KdpE
MNELLRIVVIEDDPQLRRFLRTGLELHNFNVVHALTGKEGIAAVVKHRPDAILLDLGLPDMDGKSVIEEITAWSNIPIIVISARHQVEEKIAALDAGAIDYITKPFDLGELLARIRRCLRQAIANTGESPIIRSGTVAIDLVRRVVAVGGAEIHLSPREFSLLRAMASHPDMVLTHEMLISTVWGTNNPDTVNYLRIFIGRLRQKLEIDPARPKLIVTESGVGYRLRIHPVE